MVASGFRGVGDVFKGWEVVSGVIFGLVLFFFFWKDVKFVGWLEIVRKKGEWIPGRASFFRHRTSMEFRSFFFCVFAPKLITPCFVVKFVSFIILTFRTNTET